MLAHLLFAASRGDLKSVRQVCKMLRLGALFPFSSSFAVLFYFSIALFLFISLLLSLFLFLCLSLAELTHKCTCTCTYLFCLAPQAFLTECDIEAKDHDGRTALHLACMSNSLEVVRFLLARGASVNAQDNLDLTPIAYCHVHIYMRGCICFMFVFGVFLFPFFLFPSFV